MIERAASRRPSFYKVTPWAAVFFLLASCTVVKDYRPRQPFVYETKIELVGKFTTDERKTITSSLSEQLHDSIRVRGVDKLIGWKGGPRFLYTEIRNPVHYDSLNAARSIIFMQALLHSIGYYRDSITFSHTVEE